MAGYSRIYCIGDLGGFQGSDGINRILVQIWQGEGNRQCFEARYFEGSARPLGTVRTVVPAAPDHPDNLLDACIAFLPEAFKACPSLGAVRADLDGVDMLDFDARKGVPAGWKALREEARAAFEDLVIFVADLEPLPRGASRGGARQ
jgi:hypothetical protein